DHRDARGAPGANDDDPEALRDNAAPGDNVAAGRLPPPDAAPISATPAQSQTRASGIRLAWRSNPIFIPRFHAAFGSVCARRPLAPLSVNRCELSAKSPSRNAGSRSSLTGR